MEVRTKLGALLGAAGMVLLAASATLAAPPTYFISVDKSANPANVPLAGASVTYTVAVTATGTGQFVVVNVDDGMAGCTLAGPTGDDGNLKLDPAETWSYTCTVAGVTPGTSNTAVVAACHNASPCTNSQDASGSDSVTIGEGPAVTEPPATQAPTAPPATQAPTAPPATEPPATGAPTEPPGSAAPSPTSDEAAATMSDTDAAVPGPGRVASNTLMLVIALGLLLASLVLVTPSRPVRQR